MPEPQPLEETWSVLPPRLAAPDQQSLLIWHPQSGEGEAVRYKYARKATGAHGGLLSLSQRRHPLEVMSECIQAQTRACVKAKAREGCLCNEQKYKFHMEQAHNLRSETTRKTIKS